jgi:hypothetical protein
MPVPRVGRDNRCGVEDLWASRPCDVPKNDFTQFAPNVFLNSDAVFLSLHDCCGDFDRVLIPLGSAHGCFDRHSDKRSPEPGRGHLATGLT